MTKKRMLALVNSKTFSKFIDGADLPKSVFPKSFHKLNRKLSHCELLQHSQNGVLNNIGNTSKSHSNNRQKQTSFQSKRSEILQDPPQSILNHISKLLQLENVYYLDCSFLFFVDPLVDDKVNADLRDTAVKNIQNLNKIYYELPIDIFIKSVALVDRFITKVKVKPKYMTCVATACFYIAAKTAADLSKVECPSLDSLSHMSNCGGSVDDLERMVDIILSKLNYNVETVTSYDFLLAFYKLKKAVHIKNGITLSETCDVSSLSVSSSTTPSTNVFTAPHSSSSSSSSSSLPAEQLTAAVRNRSKSSSSSNYSSCSATHETGNTDSCSSASATMNNNNNSNSNNNSKINWIQLLSLLELSQCMLRVCWHRPALLALVCLVLACDEADLPLIRTIALVCKLDLAVVSQTAETLSSLYRSTVQRRNAPNKENMVWIISKRTLSSIYASLPTTLTTIAEEDDDTHIKYEENVWSEQISWSSSLDSC